jgi:hypothetical protein
VIDDLEKDDLEQQLKKALERREAPPWFEARVLDAVSSGAAEPVQTHWWSAWRSNGNLRWVTALVAGLVLGAGITFRYETVVQERAAMERAEGEAAKARLELALRITRVKLEKIQQRVSETQRFD